MNTRARGPNILRGALVSIDQNKPTPTVIPFHYNPAMLKRTMQPQMVGGEQGDRSAPVRFTGAPVATIEVEVKLDATDALEKDNPTAVSLGLFPQLAALELLMYPQSAQMDELLAQGTMEVLPRGTRRPNQPAPRRMVEAAVLRHSSGAGAQGDDVGAANQGEAGNNANVAAQQVKLQLNRGAA